MSSHSYNQDCPKCKSVDSLIVSSSNRPYQSDSGECLECGFTYWTQTGTMDLDEVNEFREMHELAPLTKLKKMEE